MFKGDRRKRRSADYHERACEAGYMQGCFEFAKLILKRGKGARSNAEAQAHCYLLLSWIADNLACTINDAVGCFNLSLHYDYDLGVRSQPQLEVALRRHSCKLGFPDACGSLAGILKAVATGESDFHKLYEGELWLVALELEATQDNILALREKACQGKSFLDCRSLGSHYCSLAREQKKSCHLPETWAYYPEVT